MNQIKYAPTSALKPHPLNAAIYGDGCDQELLDSIKEKGIVNPILVTKSFQIISGHRRFNAAQMAGLNEVPVIIMEQNDPLEIEELLIITNKQRNKTAEQIAREYEKLKDIEKIRAKNRQSLAGGDKKSEKSLVENSPQAISEGKSRELAAEKLGISSNTAERAAKVVHHVDELRAEGKTEEAEQLRQTLNEKSVNAAYQMVKPKKEPAKPVEKTDALLHETYESGITEVQLKKPEDNEEDDEDDYEEIEDEDENEEIEDDDEEDFVWGVTDEHRPENFPYSEQEHLKILTINGIDRRIGKKTRTTIELGEGDVESLAESLFPDNERIREINSLEEISTELKKENIELQKRINHLEKIYTEDVDRNATVERRCNAQQEEIDFYKKEISNLENEIDTLKKENAKLLEEEAQSQKNNDDKEETNLREELQQYKTYHANALKKIEELQAKIDEMTKAVGDASAGTGTTVPLLVHKKLAREKAILEEKLAAAKLAAAKKKNSQVDTPQEGNEELKQEIERLKAELETAKKASQEVLSA